MLRCGISSNIANLQRLNAQYIWIPNMNQIRPKPEVIEQKNKFFENLISFYVTIEDYILENIFNFKSKIGNDSKIYVPKENIIKKHIFCENMFPYNVCKHTHHYVMWYTYQPIRYSQINNDITECLQNKLGHHQFDYVWYKNPKMTISESYHIQVFWHEILI